ncbi:MAG: hypothetical protein WC450_07345 [Candidatus Omnitrophota bacterium]|jgi:hypothetical protein
MKEHIATITDQLYGDEDPLWKEIISIGQEKHPSLKREDLIIIPRENGCTEFWVELPVKERI